MDETKGGLYTLMSEVRLWCVADDDDCLHNLYTPKIGLHLCIELIVN